jgi:asparagine synthase (glutamine-hydrolysing)
VLGFVWEFAYSWAMMLLLSIVAALREGFDVIQACNPPDTMFAIAALFRVRGVRFVFDQHDLCPEVYESRFPSGSKAIRRALLALERATYRTANHVIATNESYRQTALTRGHRRPGDVTVVRTGPDPGKLRRGPELAQWRHGRAHLCCYVGVMGPQDGVDLALRAAAVVVHELLRTDVQFVFVGAGDCYDMLRDLATSLKIDDFVDFTGRIPDDELFSVLSTADLGLSPDPLNPLNDVSTMNKTMEYMAFELPVVAFDLHETRVSAGDAAVYVEPNDVQQYAEAIVTLLDKEDERASMGRYARRRVEDVLAWQRQLPEYLNVFEQTLDR